MIIIASIDTNNGMLFNHWRQFGDRTDKSYTENH